MSGFWTKQLGVAPEEQKPQPSAAPAPVEPPVDWSVYCCHRGITMPLDTKKADCTVEFHIRFRATDGLPSLAAWLEAEGLKEGSTFFWELMWHTDLDPPIAAHLIAVRFYFYQGIHNEFDLSTVERFAEVFEGKLTFGGAQ